jgi:hypothetical protein
LDDGVAVGQLFHLKIAKRAKVSLRLGIFEVVHSRDDIKNEWLKRDRIPLQLQRGIVCSGSE